MSYDIEEGVLVVHQNGVNDPDAIRACLKSAVMDHRLRDSSDLIWVAVTAPATATPQLMQNLLRDNRHSGRLSDRMAIVVANELQYGVSRMFSVYAKEAGIEVRVFYHMDDARSWLRPG